MVHAISMGRFQFTKDETEGPQSFRRVVEEFTVAPNHLPQLVPDWVIETEHFKMLENDGSVQVWTPTGLVALPSQSIDLAIGSNTDLAALSTTGVGAPVNVAVES
jgi:hypothetical protein